MQEIDTDFDYENRGRVIEYLEDKYGEENVSHIATVAFLGVKSGIRDVGRALGIPFSKVNGINKKIDTILDTPSPKFKDFDNLKNGGPRDKSAWEEFNKLEEENKELFRVARRFEGVARNSGVHASGILVTPEPISNNIPTRLSKEGVRVSIYTGDDLEDLNYLKFDILGLKTISVIKNTLRYIDEELTFDHLYEKIKFDDKNVYQIMRDKKTAGMFQIESNLFRGLIEEIKPSDFNDIIVMTSIGRPGPLNAGFNKDYADRKSGTKKVVEPLPNTLDIVEDSLGVIVYQEQTMLISQRVAGFSDNQADSYLRKAFTSKDIPKMNLCKRWFVYGKVNREAPEGYDHENEDQVMYDPTGEYGEPVVGGINNGYKESDLLSFWKNIEGFANYLLKRKHYVLIAKQP